MLETRRQAGLGVQKKAIVVSGDLRGDSVQLGGYAGYII